MADELLDAKQVANRLSVSLRTVYEWVRRRRVASVRVGRTLRVFWPIRLPTANRKVEED